MIPGLMDYGMRSSEIENACVNTCIVVRTPVANRRIRVIIRPDGSENLVKVKVKSEK